MMRHNSIFYQLIPAKIKCAIRRSKLYVKHKSSPINIYHCCVHRTGSQWIRKILSDERTYRYSHLRTFHYQSTLPGGYDPRKITKRSFSTPFPSYTIISPLYIDYANFAHIPKPKAWKAFFVMRDPRDIVTSWYFSVKYSHSLIGDVPLHRERLNSMSFKEGVSYCMDKLEEGGLFFALRSWKDVRDKNILLLTFEEMIEPDSFDIFKRLFLHCDISIPDKKLTRLLQDCSFKRLSGREQGTEDKFAHYRKGIHGDWRKYFDDTIIEKFKDVTGDLLVHLGYENNLNWGAI